MAKSKFILTMDKSIADKLIQDGFSLISDNDNKYIFANSKTITFADIDKTKITYTNMLFL